MIKNTGKLAGKTAFITGGSRGIGKAIALKLARDGANIVIAAKTAETNPKLPGTIYTAAEELEKAGGKCLPCIVDVRDEDQVQSAVESAVKKFGSIDFLINNASAISLTGTIETPMKRYDLMHGINTRGTYLVSQKCIPYLKQSKSAHILNISPPLNMSPKWFANHVAYTMAKYGMSMCVLGMAEELRHIPIAVNALWPRTGIWTAAMSMLGGEEASKQCRKPEIMADAAYVILSRDPGNFTGKFLIDDEVLQEQGMTNFDEYAVEPGHPLLPDFFLDEAGDPETVSRLISESGGKPKWEVKKESTAAAAPSVEGLFKQIEPLITPEMIGAANALYVFNLTGSTAGEYFLDLKSASGGCGKGAPSGDVDVTFTLDSDLFVQMFLGKMKPTQAVMSGKMKFKGSMEKALKLEKMMAQIKLSAPAAGAPSSGAAAGSGEIGALFEKLRGLMNADLVAATQAVYQFQLTGAETGTWHLDLKTGSGACGSGESASADVFFTLDSADFMKMFAGQLKPTAAFMSGKMKIKGDMGKAIKLEKLMGQVKSKL